VLRIYVSLLLLYRLSGGGAYYLRGFSLEIVQTCTNNEYKKYSSQTITKSKDPTIKQHHSYLTSYQNHPTPTEYVKDPRKRSPQSTNL